MLDVRLDKRSRGAHRYQGRVTRALEEVSLEKWCTTHDPQLKLKQVCIVGCATWSVRTCGSCIRCNQSYHVKTAAIDMIDIRFLGNREVAQALLSLYMKCLAIHTCRHSILYAINVSKPTNHIPRLPASNTGSQYHQIGTSYSNENVITRSCCCNSPSDESASRDEDAWLRVLELPNWLTESASVSTRRSH
jgi:hypothetical protein